MIEIETCRRPAPGTGRRALCLHPGGAPSLGFAEAMLAGLARDGGLYVPESWPRLDPPTIAGFAGRPYAEVAVEVIRPFVGDAIARGRSRPHGARGLRHLPPSRRGAARATRRPTLSCSSFFTAHARLQGSGDAASGAADGPCARRARRAHHHRRSRPRAIPAAPPSKRSAAAPRSTSSCCFPHGRISDVQRRMMTTARRPTSTRSPIDGTFDDCQAIVKGMFNHHAFRDRVRLSGVNSINWARIVAQTVYYFTAAVALGAPQRKVAFTVPTGNFGDVYAGYVAAAHGPADRPAGDRDQRQRHSGPHARDRRVRTARRGADHLAVDGHPGLVEFRTAAVRRLWPRRRARCAR